ncbi:MAG: hypothetical protein WAU91_14145 [Desulfatitalea sp.]
MYTFKKEIQKVTSIRNGLLVMVSLLCFSFVLSCGSSSDGTALAQEDPDDSGLSRQELFYATMADTTPVYALISSSAAQARASVMPARDHIPRGAWGEPSSLYSVFFTLREFQSPRDEGVVDRSNFYKLLYDAESILMGSYGDAEDLAEPTQIASPFAGIDTSAATFTKAANIEDDELSIAYNDTDEALEALMTWKWTEADQPAKAERGIAFYVLDKATQDVSIDMVFSVDYDIATPESTYNLRCKARGNAADHSFEFNYLIGSTAIIAKGVSQGENNYVIFKYSSGGSTYYLRVPAGADETFFQELYDAGTPLTEDPETLEDEEGYLTWIQAQQFMTESDLLTSTEDLNIGVDGFAGLIDLVF